MLCAARGGGEEFTAWMDSCRPQRSVTSREASGRRLHVRGELRGIGVGDGADAGLVRNRSEGSIGLRAGSQKALNILKRRLALRDWGFKFRAGPRHVEEITMESTGLDLPGRRPATTAPGVRRWVPPSHVPQVGGTGEFRWARPSRHAVLLETGLQVFASPVDSGEGRPSLSQTFQRK